MNIINRLHEGQLIREGAGVKLHRYIGTERNNDLDPFLLLDVFNSSDPMDYIAGFPPHPHRGFETITYVLDGAIEHRDNHDHHGIISAGDVQWMTAGKGIIHSEMPKDTGRLWGMQLWLNLPAAQKMMEPRYQEFKAAELPIEAKQDGCRIKVIAGSTSQGTSSPIKGVVTEPRFFDIHLPTAASYDLELSKAHQAILFVLTGTLRIQNGSEQTRVAQNTMVGFKNEGLITLEGETSDCQCLFIEAKRIGEPVERLGPFVMNTREEVQQAVSDFQNQRF
jgi:redox-sensitive bicupin YhaK (pirin superfamily)